MEASKTLKQTEALNERMTREAGLLNFQLVVAPDYSGNTYIHGNGEDEITKWCMKKLFDGGIEEKLEELAMRGTQLNFISTTRERSLQLKKALKCPLPPFSKPFSKVRSNEDIREAWGDLWQAIAPKSKQYGGPLPLGWGEEDEDIWKIFKGASYAKEVNSLLKEKGIQMTFTQFLRSKIESIYMEHFEDQDKLENYFFGFQGIAMPNLGFWLNEKEEEEIEGESLEQEQPEKENEEMSQDGRKSKEGRKSEERVEKRLRQAEEDQEQVNRIMADVINKRNQEELHETAFCVDEDDNSFANLSWDDSEVNDPDEPANLLQPGLLLSIMERKYHEIKEEPMFQVLDKRQGCLGTELCISDGEHKVWTRPGTVQARTVFGHTERLTILQVKKLSFYKGWVVLDMVSPTPGYRPSEIILAQLFIHEITELSKATQENAAQLYNHGRVAIFPRESPVRSQPSSSPQHFQRSPTSFPGRFSSQPSRQLSGQPSQQLSGQPSLQLSGQPSRQPHSQPSQHISSQPPWQPSSQPLTGGHGSVPGPSTSSASQPSCSPNTVHSARGTSRHKCTLWCNKTFPSKAMRDYHEQLSGKRGECGK